MLADDPLNHDDEMYEEGDESTPLMSEALLYNLVGKEDARSILVRWKLIREAANEDSKVRAYADKFFGGDYQRALAAIKKQRGQ